MRGSVDDGTVTIAIDDEGPGLPQGFERDAFEPFRRGPTTSTNGAGDGSGLGLAIVKAIAESHDGTAKAENLVGSRAVHGLSEQFKTRQISRRPSSRTRRSQQSSTWTTTTMVSSSSWVPRTAWSRRPRSVSTTRRGWD